MERNNFAGSKKKAASEDYLIFFADEASVSLTPFISHTYAPCGKRPAINISMEVNSRVYLSSAVSAKGDMVYQLRDKPYDGLAIVGFLNLMLESVSGKILIIWDNASIHDCEVVRTFLSTEERAKRLHLVKQPTYSPELNADEQVWRHLKCVQLKNTCNRNIKELKPKLIEGLEKIKNNQYLINQFFQHQDVAYYS